MRIFTQNFYSMTLTHRTISLLIVLLTALALTPNSATAQQKPIENLPNVFTPNNDGLNDFFEIKATGSPYFVLHVYSRTGAPIYRGEAQEIKWDGRNNQGHLLPNGIYYYVIEDKNGEYESTKGFVYIYGQ